MGKKKLPDSYLEEIINFYLDNHTLRETIDMIYRKYKIQISQEGLKKRFAKKKIRLRTREECIKLFLIKKLDKRTIDKIIKLYTEKALSLKKIAKLLKINRRIITRTLKENKVKIIEKETAMRRANTKHDRLNFAGDENEKFYLIGFRLGDLYVRKKSKYTLEVTASTTHISFLDLLQSLFERYGPIWIYPAKNKEQYSWRITIYLDLTSFNFLLNKDIPSLESSFFYFLAGLIDSDGSVIIRKTGKYFQYAIRIFSQDTMLLNEIKKRLISLGFSPYSYVNNKEGVELVSKYVTTRSNKDNHVLELSQKEEVVRLLNKIPLRHPEKTLLKGTILDIYNQNKVYYKDIKNIIKNIRSKIKVNVYSSVKKAKYKYNQKRKRKLSFKDG